MKVCVCGSRYWKNKDFVDEKLDSLLQYVEDPSTVTILEGGATGVDAFAKEYAKKRNMNCQEYPADWDKLGKAAGPIRNEKMIKDCNWVIAFLQKGKENKGTQNAISQAKKLQKVLFVFED